MLNRRIDKVKVLAWTTTLDRYFTLSNPSLAQTYVSVQDPRKLGGWCKARVGGGKCHYYVFFRKNNEKRPTYSSQRRNTLVIEQTGK